MTGTSRPSGVGLPTASGVDIFRDPLPPPSHSRSHAHPAPVSRAPPAQLALAQPEPPADHAQHAQPSESSYLAPPSQPSRSKPYEKERTSTISDNSAFDYALLSDRAARQQRQQRQVTPLATPHRKRQRINGDRFIPTRSGRDLQSGFRLIQEPEPATPARQRRRVPRVPTQTSEDADRTFTEVLRAELFDDTVPPLQSAGSPYRTPPRNSGMAPATPQKNLFTYISPQHQNIAGLSTPSRTPQSRRSLDPDVFSEVYNTTPFRYSSQQMLLTPRRQPRAVSKVPFKVLDAPGLVDDYYLNLVDWGSTDILGVGLGNAVYLWNGQTGKVNKLCTLEDDKITSVSWIQKGTHLAVGTKKGLVQIWDAERAKRLRTMTGHSARVGSLAWNAHILSSGSRDRLIYHRDVRAPDQWFRKLVGHKQEVCGLKWNCQENQLASGSNDNKLIVWDKVSDAPLWKFSEHTAAVKAIAWSPHQRGLLASGGGTADRRIIFRNTLTGVVKNEIDTGSQVCNIAWSKNSNEIVSTHGYSQNQVVIWKYPSMTQVANLTGHTYRVLYLSMSPDGRTVVTGAGDETLRFWEVFNKRPTFRLDGNDAIGTPVIR